jgi:radical SAM superfamily enzyme YgiQ (UPF0313 family)
MLILPEDVKARRVLLFYANGEQEPWPVMPIGLCFVAAALQSRGHTVEEVDLMFEKDWPGRVQRSIARFAPDFIGVSIRNIDNVDFFDNRCYLEAVRDGVVRPARRATDAPIMIGGAAVNIMPGKVLEYVGGDFAVYGDGEVTACRLVESWSGEATPPIDGVVPSDRTSAEAAIAEPCRIPDLATVRQPRTFMWVDVERYLGSGSPYPVQTKRGCAFDCSFCVYGQIEGRRYRLHDPEAIADEIEVARARGMRQFEFTDSMFNVPLGHAENVCRSIVGRKLEVGLTTSGVSPAHFTRELMDLMERAGFEDFSFAPDTASAAVLEGLGKGYTSPQVLVDAAELAAESTMRVMWWFSFGLPGESADTVDETLDFVRRRVRPCDLVLAAVGLRILPGTRLAKIAVAEGTLAADDDLLEPVFYRPQRISLEAIHDRVQSAALRIPNMVLASDTRSFALYLKLAIPAKRMLGFPSPVWSAIPALNRVSNVVRRAAVALRPPPPMRPPEVPPPAAH